MWNSYELLPSSAPQLRTITEQGALANAGALSFIRGVVLPIARFARQPRTRQPWLHKLHSLLVGAVHFFLQFLQKLRALLGA
jgi:hypothetical protein